MKRGLAVLGTLLALGGCHATVELDPDHLDAGSDASLAQNDGGDDTGELVDASDVGLDARDALGCYTLGAVCGSASECCSGRCGTGLRCESAACSVAGAACGASADCCSGECVGSVCVAVSGCAPSGEPCAHGAECCSRTCAEDETGTTVCQPLGGCSVGGELCRRDEECCSGVAGGCAGIDPVSGLGRCAATTGCAVDGEICRVAGDSSATRECCPVGAGHALCHPTGVGVVDRCVSMRAASACIVPGSACATPDECCSRVCSADGTGAFVCQPSCLPTGAVCSRSADCCTGACSSGACIGIAVCAPLGATCATSADCCSLQCGAGLTCEAGPI